MRILIFGDVIGKPGRRAITKILPELKEKTQADLVIANAENISHGIGATESALKECTQAGVDFYTSGNHIWKKREIVGYMDRPDTTILRPANYPPGLPGYGEKVITIGTKSVLVINLMGRVFFREAVDCPFRALDQILHSYYLRNLPEPSPTAQPVDIILVDFHAEATSEKNALARYADGRITALWGTHTHIPTADAQVLPSGTAYITDVGMVGLKNSIIGANTQGVIQQFLTQIGQPEMHDIEDNGVVVVTTALLTIENNLSSFKLIQQEVEV